MVGWLLPSNKPQLQHKLLLYIACLFWVSFLIFLLILLILFLKNTIGDSLSCPVWRVPQHDLSTCVPIPTLSVTDQVPVERCGISQRQTHRHRSKIILKKTKITISNALLGIERWNFIYIHTCIFKGVTILAKPQPYYSRIHPSRDAKIFSQFLVQSAPTNHHFAVNNFWENNFILYKLL